MADVRDPPVALMVNHRLIRAPRLEVAVADEPHVLRFGLARGRHDLRAFSPPTGTGRDARQSPRENQRRVKPPTCLSAHSTPLQWKRRIGKRVMDRRTPLISAPW